MENRKELALEIVNTALELGYEKCGIIATHEMKDYGEMLTKRISQVPESKEVYQPLYRYANPSGQFPWAKSIIICAMRYGNYHIPENLKGKIAKYYLVDGRIDPHSQNYKNSIAFEKYLHTTGLRAETDRKFGLTALRWAALKAGIGLIRRNNFFYTERGSWVHLEAFLIDQPLEFKEESALKPCPKNCNLCIKTCPTKSLCAPYTMNRNTCVSNLTTWANNDLTKDPNAKFIGDWIYGCDACQDICPFNAHQWEEIHAFPGLEALSEIMKLEDLLTMDYDTLGEILLSKFFYIGPDRLWKWKTNLLNAMLNNYNHHYEDAIKIACNDENINVSNTAQWVRDSLGL